MSKLSRGRFGRTLILISTVAMMLSVSARALEVTIGWDAPTENEDGTPLTDLAGYRVYHGIESGAYSQVSPQVTEEQYTVAGLDTEQTYYFAVTALDTSGNESDFSEELERLAKAITPVMVSGPSGLPDSLLVSISSGTEACSIHVTLDGSTPTAASPVYSGPILLVATTTLKAIAVKDGMRDSNIAEETFSIVMTPNQPPLLAAIANQSDVEGDSMFLAISATDADGDVLFYTADGLPAGLSIDNESGIIAGTLTYTAAGNHTVTVTVTDGTDFDNASFIWTVTNVNLPPTVALTAPANGASVQAGSSITISASASDPDGSIARVEFRRNGQLLGQDTTSPYTYTWGNLTEGTYTLTATAIDNDGASTESAGRTITVTPAPNQPPVLTALPNRSDAEGAAVTLQPAASDPDGDTLTFAASGLPEGLSINPGTGAISGTLPHTAAGTYSTTITVTDGTDSASTSFIWTVTNVNLPPTAALTAPANGASVQAGSSITISASASDPDGSIARVEFRRNGQLLGQDTTSPYTYTWGNLTEGTYTLTATAIDNDGASTESAGRTITVTPAPNQPPVLTALPNRSDAEGAAVTLQPAASDPDGDTLTFAASGLPEGLSINPGTGAISGTLPHTAAGTYSTTITVTDGTDSDSTSFAWTVTNVNLPPTVALTAPADGASVQAGSSITISASASDPDGSIARVEFRRNGQLLGQDTTSPYTYIWGNLTEGTYTLTATAIDNDGASTESAGRAITVTPEPNQPPVLAGVADQSHAAGNTVSLQLSASDPDGDSLTFSATGLPEGLTLHSASGLIAGTLASTSAGTHSVAVTATDGKDTDSASFTWTVSAPPKQAPTAVVVSPSDGDGCDEGDTILFVADATAPGGSIKQVDFYANGQKLATDTRSPYVFTWGNASAGDYELKVKATDNLGAVAESPVHLFTVFVPPNKMPTGILTAPTAESTFTEGDPITLAADAADPDGSVERVDFLADGAVIGSDATAPYSFTWHFAPAGTYSLAARIIDNEGATTLTAAHTISVETSTVQLHVFEQDGGIDGIVAIETENYHAYTSGDRSGWSLISDAYASGEVAIKSNLNGNESEDGTFETTSARLDYQVEFNRSGTHYVWLRGASNNRQAGSVFIGLNGAGAEPDARIAGIEDRTLVWTAETESGLAAAVHVPSPGVHTLHLWVREKNVTVDKVILTTNPAFVPVGLGPQENYQTPTYVSAAQTAPTQPTPPSLTLAPDPSGDRITLSFLRNLMDKDTEYAVESSTDMINWVPYPGNVSNIATATSGGQVETCIVELEAPPPIQGQALIVRVRVRSSELLSESTWVRPPAVPVR